MIWPISNDTRIAVARPLKSDLFTEHGKAEFFRSSCDLGLRNNLSVLFLKAQEKGARAKKEIREI